MYMSYQKSVYAEKVVQDLIVFSLFFSSPLCHCNNQMWTLLIKPQVTVFDLSKHNFAFHRAVYFRNKMFLI